MLQGINFVSLAILLETILERELVKQVTNSQYETKDTQIYTYTHTHTLTQSFQETCNRFYFFPEQMQIRCFCRSEEVLINGSEPLLFRMQNVQCYEKWPCEELQKFIKLGSVCRAMHT